MSTSIQHSKSDSRHLNLNFEGLQATRPVHRTLSVGYCRNDAIHLCLSNKHLHAILHRREQKRRAYDARQVTIPWDKE